ncbi:MAG TPA: hypothetical protein VIM31_01355 [Candidatus Microsaccharimonas sp.]
MEQNPSVPTTSKVIILGEDMIDHLPPFATFDPDFIGPRNATNEARPLLETQSRNLAQVAVMNFPAYNHQFVRVVEAAKLSVSEGRLQLNAEFRNMHPDQQIEQFVTTAMMSAYKPRDEVVAELKTEKEKLRLGLGGPDKELQLELNSTRDLMAKQANRILSVRSKLVERGASEEFMREFDYTTKLMTKPEQEAYEHEKELTPEAEVAPLVDTGAIHLLDMFRNVLGPSFGRKALRSIGIHSPKSGEVTVVKQKESTAS